MAYINILPSKDSGKAYYLQLIGTNTSAGNPWVVPDGHSVIGREGSYLIVRIDAEDDRWDKGRDDRFKEEDDGLQDGPRSSPEGTG